MMRKVLTETYNLGLDSEGEENAQGKTEEIKEGGDNTEEIKEGGEEIEEPVNDKEEGTTEHLAESK